MENLSQWFDLSVQKPWEEGVYKMLYPGLEENEIYSFFDGSAFNSGWFSIKRAIENKTSGPDGLTEPTHWRGLSNPPIDPKHLARRTDPQTSKDAAIIAVSTGHIATHCERIWNCLGEYGSQNANEVAARLGLHAHQVLKRFSDLHKMKKASRTGEVRHGQSVWNAI